MIGQQASAADAEFGVAFGSGHAVDELDAGPDAAGILPAAAGAAEPFAEDGARGDEAAVGFFEAAGEGGDLAGGAHADRDQAGQQIGGDGEARAFGNIVDLADDFDAAVRGVPVRRARSSASGWRGAFHTGGHDAAGDDGGLEQAQVVAREIEDFGDAR